MNASTIIHPPHVVAHQTSLRFYYPATTRCGRPLCSVAFSQLGSTADLAALGDQVVELCSSIRHSSPSLGNPSGPRIISDVLTACTPKSTRAALVSACLRARSPVRRITSTLSIVLTGYLLIITQALIHESRINVQCKPSSQNGCLQLRSALETSIHIPSRTSPSLSPSCTLPCLLCPAPTIHSH